MLLANKIFKAMLSKWNKDFEFRFESSLFFFIFHRKLRGTKKYQIKFWKEVLIQKTAFSKFQSMVASIVKLSSASMYYHTGTVMSS